MSNVDPATVAALVAAVKLAVAEAVAEQLGRPTALLLTATEARDLLGLKKTAWHRLRSAGRLPAPVDAGGLKWKRADLVAFVERLKPARRRQR